MSIAWVCRSGGRAEGCTAANRFCRLIYSDFLERETLIEPQKVNIYISRERDRGVNRGGKSCVDFNPMQDLLGHRVSFSHPAREFRGIESARIACHAHATSNTEQFPFSFIRVVKFPEIERRFVICRETGIVRPSPCRITPPRHRHRQLTAIIAWLSTQPEETHCKCDIQIATFFSQPIIQRGDNFLLASALSPIEIRHCVAFNADPTIQNDPMAAQSPDVTLSSRIGNLDSTPCNG